jgi:hypothetical protein
MRQTARFFLHCAIAFFFVVVMTLTIQLILNAPMPVGGQVAALKIKSVLIPGRALSCQQTGMRQSRCQIELFDRSLNLTVKSAPNANILEQCQLSYADQTTGCKGDFNTFIIGGWQPAVSTESDLGLSAAQFADLREQYPQRNFFLQSVGEDRLLKGATQVAIAAGILTVLLGWLHFSNLTVFLGAGLLVSMVTWAIATALIWGLGYVD